MSHDRKRVIIKPTRKKEMCCCTEENENKVTFVFLLKNFEFLFTVHCGGDTGGETWNENAAVTLNNFTFTKKR